MKPFHGDFRVRRFFVQEALTWLLQNSRYYIANAIPLNEEALQQLPQDGNVNNITALHLGESSSVQSDLCDDQYRAHLTATQQRTEKAAVSSRPAEWIISHPHGAYYWRSSVHHFSMAFPTLFPSGAADFLGERCNQVTIGNYFTHLLKYDDG